MLALSDPLWEKLDDAHRDLDIPAVLSELAGAWDDEQATGLFWDYLCHQETCYGATYAAVPHLLEIAQPEENKQQRLDIAIFLGAVVLSAFDPKSLMDGALEDAPLRGLSLTPDDWERKRDVYRSLVASLEDGSRPVSHFERSELLSRYREVLARNAVDEGDLEKIKALRVEFLEALPKIAALCRRALQENLQNREALKYLLSGVAAGEGLLDVARLLESGAEGGLRCGSCGWECEYLLFGDRIAIYADDQAPGETYGQAAKDDHGFLDRKDGMPTRSDGFISPLADDDEIADDRISQLLSIAEQLPDQELAHLLRNALGRFVCTKCGVEGPVRGL